MDPDGLVEIHFLFAELLVVDNHHQIIVHVLRVGPPQRQRDRSEALELPGLSEVKFKVAPLTAFFQHDQFIMCFGDRAAELVFRGIEIGLEIGPVLGYLVLRFLQLFLLVFQLRLQLFVALVRHRRAVLGSRRRVGVFFRGRLRGTCSRIRTRVTE